ncbi:MAG: phosphoenolpyruvate synthase [Thermoplasmata archaeon HGW-Thermoplasmata-1]|nr:MAG: phosphoenolpyruvate synthase [Thermoplasmata archaeon HGW-Thermoplasmata-1]
MIDSTKAGVASKSGLDAAVRAKPEFRGYHDLMRVKMREILLVSSPYDAFILEEDGGLSERIFGEYQDLDLSSPPRINRVSSAAEALGELKRHEYNLVVTMTHLFDLDPLEFGRMAKEIQPGIPVVLLVTNTADLPHYHKPGDYGSVDKVFLWTGDSALFLAITKYFEDRANVDADTTNGQVRVILIIENSCRYYSVFLPMMYTEVLRQTQELVSKSLNEHERFLRRRARPKILLAETFEEAMELYTRHREYIMGVITDVAYPRDGCNDDGAGFCFAQAVDGYVPVLVQSSHGEHRARAESMSLPFLEKNSETLLADLRKFMKRRLGFGDFIFKLPSGRRVGKAASIKELADMLESIPAESLIYHGEANNFSNWLMARGEFELARELRQRCVSDFASEEEVRRYLLRTFREWRRRRHFDIITDFEQQDFELEETFTKYGTGSLGGKGRGLAFLASLLRKSGLIDNYPEWHIGIPSTLVVATDEFDRFMSLNGLYEKIRVNMDDADIASLFAAGRLSAKMRKSLRSYLKSVRYPLAVRSSSLLEDSYNQPFAGIYATYLIPNNHQDDDTRLNQLCLAIKLVYASTFFKAARAYLQTTSHTVEEERMAVVIQKVVGNGFDDRFYPAFSGVGQSRNFYPLAPLTREEGIVSAALGLGKTVVDGGRAVSFSPKRPGAMPGFSTVEEMLRSSQSNFYAIDMGKSDFDLLCGEGETLRLCDLGDAEEDGTLDQIGSVYDINDGIVRDGIWSDGARIVTFAGMLKHSAFPLAPIMDDLLKLSEMGIGGSVEVEFASSLDEEKRPRLFVLQIRPFLAMRESRAVAINEEEIAGSIAYSENALGNGILDNVRDVVFIPPELFDNSKTYEIAAELEKMNRKLEGTPYVLIGAGRWGSSDRWLGVPVNWSQISNARAIVEVTLEGFRVDPSHGSHFFHNIQYLRKKIVINRIPYNQVNHTTFIFSAHSPQIEGFK